jgi:hypothetical protein
MNPSDDDRLLAKQWDIVCDLLDTFGIRLNYLDSYERQCPIKISKEARRCLLTEIAAAINVEKEEEGNTNEPS